MNKKLLVLAIAAALAPAAAMADSGNVKISGSLHMSLDSTDTLNATGTGLGKQWNVSSNTSNIVLEGNEDVGNGLSAVWKVTSILRMDDNQAGVAAPVGDPAVAGAAIGNGNTYLGLSSKTAGTAILGKHDTPFKLLGRSVDLFGDQIGDARNLTNYGGAGWDLRPNNVVAYLSPSFSGFSAVIAHVTNTTSTVRADEPSGANMQAVSADSLLGSYNNGPLSLGLAWERHDLSNAATANNDESAYRLAGAYTIDALKLTGLYQKMTDIGGGSNDRKVWGLGAGYTMGNNVIKAQYYRAGDLGSTSNSGANMWALGVDHNLSKRTAVYVALARTGNDSASGNVYGVSGGGHGDNTTTGIAASGLTGQDINSFSLGMKHSF